MAKTIKVNLIQRTDTKLNWESVNPVLINNERVFEIQPDGSRKEKIGDGVTRYTALPYHPGSLPGGGVSPELIGDLALLQTEDKSNLVAAINSALDEAKIDESEVNETLQFDNDGKLGVNMAKVNPGLTKSIMSVVKVGGINEGDVLEAGLVYTDFVERVLNPTLYPNLVNPTFALAHAESALIEIGTSLTVDLVFQYYRGNIQATWTGGTDRPRAGLASAYRFYYSDNTLIQSSSSPNISFSGYEVIQGGNLFRAEVDFAAGPQPLDSKGQDIDNPYPGGTSPRRTTTFEGVYGIYGSTTNILTSSRQTLVSMLTGNNVQLNLVAESNGNKQFFEVAEAWLNARNLTAVNYFDALTNSFGTANKRSEFTQSSVSKTIQGKNVPFARFTYSGSARGAITIRLVFAN